MVGLIIIIGVAFLVSYSRQSRFNNRSQFGWKRLFVMSKKRGRPTYEMVTAELAEARKLVAEVSPLKKIKTASNWVAELDTPEMTLYNQLDGAIRLVISREPEASPDSLIDLCGTVIKTVNAFQTVIDNLHESLADVVSARDKDCEARHEKLRQKILISRLSTPQCAIIDGMEKMSKEQLAQFREFAEYAIQNADFLTDFSKDLNPHHEVEELINQAFEERNVRLLKDAKKPPKRYDRANPRFASPPRVGLQPSLSSPSFSSSQGIQFGREDFYNGLVPLTGLAGQ